MKERRSSPELPAAQAPAPVAAQRGNAALQRRRTVRIESELEVDFSSESNFFTGFTEDLSDGGIFIATYEQRAVGDRLAIRLTIPELDEPIVAKVEVRWVRLYDPTSEISPGFGAEFIELGDRERDAIQRFLARRQPLFHPI